MLDSVWISYMVLLVLGFAQAPCFAVDSSAELMKRGSAISSNLTKPNRSTCPETPPFCPAFLKEVIRDDKSDGYFIDFNFLGQNIQAGKMLDGRFPICTKAVSGKDSFQKKIFSSPQAIQSYAEKTLYPQMGYHIHQSVRGCIAQDPANGFNTTTKYYYAMGRLDQGLQDVQNEIVRIDSILGDQKSLNKCLSTFMDANIQCKALMNCPQKSGQLEAVVAQSLKDEALYQKNLDEIKKLGSGCLALRKEYHSFEKAIEKSGKVENCDLVATVDGAGQGSCTTLTLAGLKEIRACEEREKGFFNALAILEKTNPWFIDSNYFSNRKKGAQPGPLISQYLKKTRNALQDLQKDIEKSAVCLAGSEYRSCDVEKLRKTLQSVRELPATKGDTRESIGFENYMIAQRCVEESSNERNDTSSLLRVSGRDAALTLLTAGIGGVVAKGAIWAGREIEATSLGTMAEESAGLLVSRFYLGDSLRKSIQSCLLEFDKQQVAFNGSTKGPMCPDPMAERVAAKKALESCNGSIAETALNTLPLAPAALKSVRKTLQSSRQEHYEPSGWVDHSKRTDVPTAHKTPDSPRPLVRERFIEENLNKEFATVEQNQEWIQLAENAAPDGKTRYFEWENSVMKELNDVTQDKNFVTALTNKHKEMMQTELNEILTKYPGVDFPYHDFKSGRLIFKPKPPAKSLPKEFERELNEAFQRANKKYANYLKDNHLVREGDKPEEWFRSGFGETADQASLAARYSRNASGSNKMRSFSDGDLQENLNTTLQASELYRSQLQTDLGNSGLMSYVAGSSKKTLNQEVFDMVRKTKTPEDLMAAVKKTKGIELTEAQAMRMRDYAGLVDEFSPSIRIAKREIASLSDSAAGGLSLDFAGMGSRNAQGTADALARSKNVTEALQMSRRGEKEVTDVFREKKEKVRGAIDSILKKYKIESEIIASGDDMVVKPAQPIPEKARREITESLAQVINPSDIRVSHVPGYVTKEADRALLGTHGETIEKLTRKNLQGQLPPEKLQQLLLMVDMKGNAAGQGSVNLMTGSGVVRLNESEQQQIQKAFKKAVESLNNDLKQSKEIGNYKASGF